MHQEDSEKLDNKVYLLDARLLHSLHQQGISSIEDLVQQRMLSFIVSIVNLPEAAASRKV